MTIVAKSKMESLGTYTGGNNGNFLLHVNNCIDSFNSCIVYYVYCIESISIIMTCFLDDPDLKI